MDRLAKHILLIIASVILGVVIGFVAVANSTELTIENCMDNTWVGAVKWEWKDGIRGNYIGSDYTHIPELEIKGVGAVSADVAPGDYAITHYRPPMSATAGDGTLFILPSKVVNFKEVLVESDPVTVYFGCEE